MVATSTPLVVIELLAASVWVGSMVCLTVVARVARQVLDGPSQVNFFRGVGRRYGILGTVSLLVALSAGLALAWPPSAWSMTIDAAVALAGLLVIATAVGMAQARAMTRLRRRAISVPPEIGVGAAIRRGRMVAGALRSLMAVLTLAIVVLASIAITQ